MKSIGKLVLISLLIFQVSFAAVTYGFDAVNRYIFRGVDCGDPVNYNNDKGKYNNSPAFQPYVGYDFGNGLSITTWASFGVGSYSSQELDELDITAAYAYNLGDVAMQIGYTHYTFPSWQKYEEQINELDSKDALALTDSDEAFIGATFTKVFLTPSLRIYNDYDQNLVKADRTQYTYTELGFVLPEIYGMGQSLTFSFDSTYSSPGLTQVIYGLTKPLSYGFSSYAKVIYLPGSSGMASFVGAASKYTADGHVRERDLVNEDDYELVFGINYAGSMF